MNDKLDGLLWGSLIGDALTLAAHWDYDPRHIAATFGRITGYLAPAADHYHGKKAAGEFTHYGDQTMVLLESVTERGGFDLADFATRWQALWPDYTGYVDGATKGALANFAAGKSPSESGSPSRDLSAAGRIAPLVHRLAKSPDSQLLVAVTDQTALTHNNPDVIQAAKYFAAVTRKVLEGSNVEDALRACATTQDANLQGAAAALQAASVQLDHSPVDALGQLGRTCPVEDALPATLYFLLRYPEDIETALIENTMAGGDSAARGLIIGMVLGARVGLKGIPQHWIEGLKAKPRVEELIVRTES